MVTVRSRNHGGVVISHVLAHDETRPICQNDVVFRQKAFFCYRWRRDDNGEARAEAYRKDGAEGVREMAESPV